MGFHTTIPLHTRGHRSCLAPETTEGPEATTAGLVALMVAEQLGLLIVEQQQSQLEITVLELSFLAPSMKVLILMEQKTVA